MALWVFRDAVNSNTKGHGLILECSMSRPRGATLRLTSPKYVALGRLATTDCDKPRQNGLFVKAVLQTRDPIACIAKATRMTYNSSLTS